MTESGDRVLTKKLMNKTQSQADEWSEWLLHTRFANDPEHERIVRSATEVFADRVLDGARLTPGMSMLDLGTGDGLVAFRAMSRIGPSLRVLLSDISSPLLCHAKALAVERKVQNQCTFIECSAESLSGIDDASVDVVTARAVLAYVPKKSNAFESIRRVLKPGGRFSIAEPVMRDNAFEAMSLKKLVDAPPPGTEDRFFALLSRWKGAQFPNTEEKIAQSPIANYGERDLVRFALDAGFVDVHMEFHINVGSSDVNAWEILLGSSPHPWAPPLGTILAEQFTVEEKQFFEQIFRPRVEAGQLMTTERTAYLTARKPAS